MKRYISSVAICSVLLALFSSCTAEDSPSATTSSWHSGVKTDWSVLTPYQPPEEMYTRLSEEALPELVPRADYGPLLPYVGARIEGYGDDNLYGFITLDGMIVTDASYPLISLSEHGEKPVYRLIKSPDNDPEHSYHRPDTYGVCAYDGSWTTACSYAGVLCLDDVIILVRDRKTTDADVIDYGGKYLYSLKAQPYFDQLLPGLFDELLYSYKDGLLTVPLDDWSTILIDERTGARVDTGYTYTGSFSEGLAPVTNDSDKTGPFGYIDRRLDLVIEPRFYEPGGFYGGKAVVRDENGNYLIIDKTGAALFRTKDTIQHLWSGIYLVSGDGGKRWLDRDLNELPLTPGFDGEVNTLDGWYSYHAGGETILSDLKTAYTLPGVLRIISVKDGFAEYRSETNRNGIMKLDGTIIFEAKDEFTNTQTVATKNNAVFFAVNRAVDTARTYKLLNAEGGTLMEGRGSIRYDTRTGLFQISADDFFGYCDETGRFTFKISLLPWLPD